MVAVAGLELPNGSKLADLSARRVELECAVQRLELARQAEYRLAQVELIETFGGGKRFFQYQPGRVSGDGIETEIDVRIRVFLVPGFAVFLQ